MSSSSVALPVVSYARISADTRRDEHGVQDQHKLNRAAAERYGWTVVHEFTDNDKSAAEADVVRDEFEDILRALRAGKLADGTLGRLNGQQVPAAILTGGASFGGTFTLVILTIGLLRRP